MSSRKPKSAWSRAIRVQMLQRDINLRELAAQVGISYDYMRQIASDHGTPSAETFTKINAVLGVDPASYLHNNTKEVQPKCQI